MCACTVYISITTIIVSLSRLWQAKDTHNTWELATTKTTSCCSCQHFCKPATHNGAEHPFSSIVAEILYYSHAIFLCSHIVIVGRYYTFIIHNANTDSVTHPSGCKFTWKIFKVELKLFSAFSNVILNGVHIETKLISRISCSNGNG